MDLGTEYVSFQNKGSRVVVTLFVILRPNQTWSFDMVQSPLNL